MQETKECSNCGKWMIKWKDNNLYEHPDYRFKWMCACGHKEQLETSFIKAWQEANKGEK